MWRQQLKRRQSAAVGEISQTAKEDKEFQLRHNVLEAGFNPKVLLHRLDVKQMLMIKEEALINHGPCAGLHDPKPHHIKEEQEDVYTSLGGEQLNGKEDIDAIRFPVTATPIKSEDHKQSPLLPQLYQDQIKGRAHHEDIDGGEESIRMQDHGDGSVSLETKDTENMIEEDRKKCLTTTATPIKSEHGKRSPLLSQLYQDQIKGRTHHEDIDGEESTRIQDHGDGSVSLETKDTENRIEDRKKCFTATATPINSKDDKQYPLLSQLLQDQIKGGALHEDIDGGEESTRIQDHGDGSLSLETTATENGIEEDRKKCFTEKKNTESPKNVQTGLRFSCEDCGKTFVEKYTLKKHMRTHTGQKPFCCDLCGQRFSEKSSLNTHMRIHTGQKPFCCDHCGQRFNRKGNLNTHMRIHTGEKPFCCDICGQRFNRKGILNAHKEIHTGQKKFCCELCGKRFSQKTNANTHMKIHTGQKPFCCDQCGQRFNKKENLNRHMKVHSEGKMVNV